MRSSRIEERALPEAGEAPERAEKGLIETFCSVVYYWSRSSTPNTPSLARFSPGFITKRRGFFWSYQNWTK
jgi:hypothetical protein